MTVLCILRQCPDHQYRGNDNNDDNDLDYDHDYVNVVVTVVVVVVVIVFVITIMIMTVCHGLHCKPKRTHHTMHHACPKF